MRLATYNVEWFTNLFDDDGALLFDREWSGRQGVKRDEQIEALGKVFNAIDADAILVIEAPDESSHRSSVAALEAFAAWAGIRANKALIGFSNDTQQEIALLYDPAKITARHDPMGEPTGKKGLSEAPRFDGVYRIDLDVDASEDLVRFSKPPLEVALRTRAGREVILIGVHIKSKAPHGARGQHDVMRYAIANRRKQLAQAIWLRERITAHLAAGEDIVVLGDFNDGPGLDEYEKLFGRSAVEIVLGENGEESLFDPHARMALSQRVGAMPASARFYIEPEKRFLSALLDYVMVSEGLRAGGAWRIWHPFDDPTCYENLELRDALLTASDHFPVTVDLPELS